ncbi:MAG: DUF3568 family protein [Isosphaeraceae bacterium]
MRRSVLSSKALCFLLATTLTGCSSVRPFSATALTNEGTSDFSYMAGRATQTFAESPATVQPAVLAALEDLRFVAVRQDHDAGVLTFHGSTPDNRTAVVNLKPQPGGATRVVTRIGVFGDEPLSRALMDRVAVRLGTLPPTAIPIDPPSQASGNPFFSRDAVSDTEMLRDQADAPYKN